MAVLLIISAMPMALLAAETDTTPLAEDTTAAPLATSTDATLGKLGYQVDAQLVLPHSLYQEQS